MAALLSVMVPKDLVCRIVHDMISKGRALPMTMRSLALLL